MSALFDHNYLVELDQEIKTYDYNTKMVLIHRIFSRNKFIGAEEKFILKNKFYFNDTFDRLYELSISELEIMDMSLERMCYSKNIQGDGTKK